MDNCSLLANSVPDRNANRTRFSMSRFRLKLNRLLSLVPPLFLCRRFHCRIPVLSISARQKGRKKRSKQVVSPLPIDSIALWGKIIELWPTLSSSLTTIVDKKTRPEERGGVAFVTQQSKQSACATEERNRKKRRERGGGRQAREAICSHHRAVCLTRCTPVIAVSRISSIAATEISRRSMNANESIGSS